MQPLWEIWILESSKWGHQKAQQFYSQVSYQRNWQHVLTLMLVCALSGSTTDMDGKRIQVPNNWKINRSIFIQVLERRRLKSRASAFLPEHPGSIPSTYMAANNPLSLQFQGPWSPFLWEPGAHVVQAYMQAKRSENKLFSYMSII